ncbi:hypothetical protein AX16_002396 [Volvariella volvacea WC 439]|nr:hypothetical protein AX16_002396 [Volvariella volvacea WC 439]
MAISSRSQNNIWVAAGDGDLDRVRELVEHQSVSPNAPDPNTYTPMHAAASYGHLDVLEYLISHGGDVNITDEDGDTPLYTVENVETARFLVHHGAIVDRTNHEGISPIVHISEEFPQVAQFLQSILNPSMTFDPTQSASMPSQHDQNAASEQLTSNFLASVQEIMQRAEAEGRDPDEELRRLVGQTVIDGVVTGFQMTTAQDGRGPQDDSGDAGTKRPRIDDS